MLTELLIIWFKTDILTNLELRIVHLQDAIKCSTGGNASDKQVHNRLYLTFESLYHMTVMENYTYFQKYLIS